ncbi:MAG: hypothetical protein QM765_11575 [Myxococcales bacterium]
MALLIGTPFFIVFGALSDRIGRKPIIMAGCLIAALTYFPLFKALTARANPDLGRGAGHGAGDGPRRPDRVLVPVQPHRHRASSPAPATSHKKLLARNVGQLQHGRGAAGTAPRAHRRRQVRVLRRRRPVRADDVGARRPLQDRKLGEALTAAGYPGQGRSGRDPTSFDGRS